MRVVMMAGRYACLQRRLRDAARRDCSVSLLDLEELVHGDVLEDLPRAAARPHDLHGRALRRLHPDEAVARAFAHFGVEVAADAVRRSVSKRGEASEFTYYANSLGAGREDVAFQKTIVGEGEEVFLPSYTTTTSGTHRAVLTTAEAVSYLPSLQKWNGSAWVTVAVSQWDDVLDAEVCDYAGVPGQYRG